MIEENLEEANKRIEELENIIQDNQNKSHIREIVTNTIEASVDLLQVQVPFADFKNEDGSFKTIPEFCQVTNRTYTLNEDKTRFTFGYELSWSKNVYGSLEGYLNNLYGKVDAKDDFLKTEENYFNILTYSERKEFLKVNPNWVSE